MRAKHRTRASALAIGITVAGLTVGAASAVADPPNPCGFQSCQGPGAQRGPDGQRGGPSGGPQQRGDNDDRSWHPPPPPPDGAWRNIDQGRFDHQPFNYMGNWVTPVFDAGFNNWGFWFFGIWIPV
jgi:hypothetical protein